MKWILVFFVCFSVFCQSCSPQKHLMVNSNQSFKSALSQLNPGDTLYVKSGTYDLNLFNLIPSGANWDSPVVIKAVEGSKPIIRPKSGYRVLHFGNYYQNQIPVHHIEIDGLILDAKNVISDAIKITDGAHHIRIKNCEIKNSKSVGILIPHKDSDYNEIINCKVHSNGVNDFLHGIYISSDYNVVDSCEIYNNAGCGINVFNGKGTSNYNTILNCHIHNNASVGNRGTGINLHSGKGHVARNNVIHDNKNGIQVKYNSVECIVEDNLLYSHPGYSIVLGNGSTDCVARNNTIVKNFIKRHPEVLIGEKATRPKVLSTHYKENLSEVENF
jgi:parallel beta-helix repeat protein